MIDQTKGGEHAAEERPHNEELDGFPGPMMAISATGDAISTERRRHRWSGALASATTARTDGRRDIVSPVDDSRDRGHNRIRVPDSYVDEFHHIDLRIIARILRSTGIAK
ncbi:hypothetical protein ACFVW2_09575 [Streptomyces sp. NPDC058171]